MLSNEQCEKLAMMLQTSGWREVVIPVIAQRGQSAIKALCIPLSAREGIFKDRSDDSIRGSLEVYEYVLSAFQNEVTVNQANRQREEFAKNGEGVAAQGQAPTP